VEDSNFFRSHVKNYLESQGYEVIEAIDGKDGFEKLCNNRVDLIITDIEMPVMDGYSFTKKLKSDERFAHLKVMALTAMTGEEDIKKGLEAGIDNYQIKLDRENLLDAVMSFLRGDVPKAYIN
jgi:two-component system chemotaxis sensor kinase CheA